MNKQQNIQYLRAHHRELLTKCYMTPSGADIKVRRSKTYKGPQIYLNGEGVYQENPFILAKRQAKEYTPKLLSVTDRWGANDEVVGLHGEILRNLTAAVPEDVLAEPVDMGKEIPTLIVFGLGLGAHLTEILDQWYCPQHMIVVDLIPETMGTMLHGADMARVMTYFSQKGRHVTFLSTPDPVQLARSVIVAIKNYNPAMGLHIGVFDHFRCPQFEETKQKILDELFLIYRGFGFIDDELNGIKFFRDNLRSEQTLYTAKSPTEEQPAPAILVGSGPSLEENLDWLKENKKNFYIVSCGSSIGALLNNDVKPDLHVEVERGELTSVKIDELLNEPFPRDIPIIGPEVLPPEVFGKSDTPVMIRKVASAAGAHFPTNMTTKCSIGPTVANGALNAAVLLGFRDIFLLGIDMGWRGKTRTDGTKAEVCPTAVKEKTIEGADGADVESTDILIWAKTKLEVLISIANAAHAKVYNLGTYAKIKGTIPMAPEQLQFDLDAPKRKADSKILFNTCLFEVESEEADPDGLLEEIVDINRRVLDLYTSKVLSKKDRVGVMEFVSRMHLMFEYKIRPVSPAAHFLIKGTLAHFCHILWSNVACLNDPTEFVENAYDILSESLSSMLQCLSKELKL